MAASKCRRIEAIRRGVSERERSLLGTVNDVHHVINSNAGLRNVSGENDLDTHRGSTGTNKNLNL